MAGHDARPSAQEQPDRDHDREPEDEARQRGPFCEPLLLETHDDGKPQGQRLNFMA